MTPGRIEGGLVTQVAFNRDDLLERFDCSFKITRFWFTLSRFLAHLCCVKKLPDKYVSKRMDGL